MWPTPVDTLALYVSCPMAGFRVSQARDYWETYPVPPPSTCYGMLLSLVGEENRLVHVGAELAIALVSSPQRSRVLRRLWRVKVSRDGLGKGANRIPGYQELLSDVQLKLWLRPGTYESASPSLAGRVGRVLADPGSVRRHGALCLGESTHLVDDIRAWQEYDPQTGRVLVADPHGDLCLPCWVDHVGSRGTVFRQFRLQEMPLGVAHPHEVVWVTIAPEPQ
jgi:CRISPR-associated protein Cas5t